MSAWSFVSRDAEMFRVTPQQPDSVSVFTRRMQSRLVCSVVAVAGRESEEARV